MRRGLILGLFVAVVAGVMLTRWHRSNRSEGSRSARRPNRPNVILISIDTLRADRLGCYGHSVETSPTVDQLAEEGVLFERTVAAAPSTEPSHASIFTSLIPVHHGALFSRRWALHPSFVTMAEILKENGYYTASFNDGGQVDAAWGFAQGFDEYVSLRDGAEGARFTSTVEEAVEWLDRHRKERFFLFLHTYETHHPYAPPQWALDAIDHSNHTDLPSHISVELLKEFNEKRRLLSPSAKEHITAVYDAGIRSMDHALGRFIAALEGRDLYEDTLIVFTSDHGEELGERGMMGWHSHTLFDEQLLVPLIVRFPSGRYAGTRIANQVRSIDILPTLLDVVDIPPLKVFEGVSLMGELEKPGRPMRRPAVSQRDVVESDGPVSLRSDEWKLYLRTQESKQLLFDMQADPGETVNLWADRPKRIEQLQAELNQLLGARPETRRDDRRKVQPDPPLVEQLKRLGYVSDGGTANP